jgi:hypothetical protein
MPKEKKGKKTKKDKKDAPASPAASPLAEAMKSLGEVFQFVEMCQVGRRTTQHRANGAIHARDHCLQKLAGPNGALPPPPSTAPEPEPETEPTPGILFLATRHVRCIDTVEN